MPAKLTARFAALGVDVDAAAARAHQAWRSITADAPLVQQRIAHSPLRDLKYHADAPDDLRNPLMPLFLWQAALASPAIRAGEARGAVLHQAPRLLHLDLHAVDAARPLAEIDLHESRLDAREDLRSDELHLTGETAERLEAAAHLDLEIARVSEERARRRFARAAELRRVPATRAA